MSNSNSSLQQVVIDEKAPEKNIDSNYPNGSGSELDGEQEELDYENEPIITEYSSGHYEQDYSRNDMDKFTLNLNTIVLQVSITFSK